HHYAGLLQAGRQEGGLDTFAAWWYDSGYGGCVQVCFVLCNRHEMPIVYIRALSVRNSSFAGAKDEIPTLSVGMLL
ncbi:MAG: hypothetical protein IKY92_03400, partial [Akkermansia sp.]|nr:hypothetical protein [Akkermansia sp.]